MTRILIGTNDIEFQVIIPAYFRGTNNDLIKRLQRQGYNFNITGDAFAFYAESKHYPNEDQKPQLIVSVSTNQVIKDDLGSSVVEIMAKGSMAFSPVGEQMLEELIKDMMLQELDFGFSEIAFDDTRKINNLYGSRRNEREGFTKQWEKRLNLPTYDKLIPYEKPIREDKK